MLKNGLFAIKQEPSISISNSNISEPDSDNTSQKKEGMSYQEWGFIRAGLCQGSETGLETSIHSVIQQKKLEMQGRTQLQEEHRIKIRQDIAQVEQENENKELQKKSKEDSLLFEENKIKKYQEQINDLKNHPEKVTQDPASKASFIIGLTIITFLTIYLFVFYSSASFSAFFKEFSVNDIGVTNSIFDPQAIKTAWESGFTELVLILTIPFVFLGLGYLIHKFQESEGLVKYFKMGFFIIITFIFDCILAYEITEKIYNAKISDIIDSNPPPYSILAAFQSINFWMVIFAGFVVYIIWGIVFNFIMEAYSKLDKVKVQIEQWLLKINRAKNECKDIKEQIQQLNTEIKNNNAIIDKKRIELERAIFCPQEIKLEINNFFNGWISYLSGANRSNEQIKAQLIVAEILNKI